MNITEKDIHLFFIQFIEHSFPSLYMTFHSFKHFLNNLGITMHVDLLEVIFETNIRDLLWTNLSFDYLLIALICLDPNCPQIKS